jgi:hypothetical protein
MSGSDAAGLKNSYYYIPLPYRNDMHHYAPLPNDRVWVFYREWPTAWYDIDFAD